MTDNTFKSRVGPDMAHRLARELEAAHPAFDADRFAQHAVDGLDDLELKARIDHLARALHEHLPSAFPDALGILLTTLGTPLEVEEGFGDSVFYYWIHAHFVQLFGLDHPDLSLEALLEITQRATSEFAVRPYLKRYPEATLDFLRSHLGHPNPHVRRWISEGTRPRLPWGERLGAFVRDPSPTLPLLRALRDDPSKYVRTSVANHLNDIAKDHPDLAVEVVAEGLDQGLEHAEWIAKKALRHLVKQGHPGALATLGFDPAPRLSLHGLALEPGRIRVGEKLRFTFELEADAGADSEQALMIDYAIDFRLARGKTGRKVFKLTTRKLRRGERIRIEKTHPLRPISTRRYYPGQHALAILVNGREMGAIDFELMV